MLGTQACFGRFEKDSLFSDKNCGALSFIKSCIDLQLLSFGRSEVTYKEGRLLSVSPGFSSNLPASHRAQECSIAEEFVCRQCHMAGSTDSC